MVGVIYETLIDLFCESIIKHIIYLKLNRMKKLVTLEVKIIEQFFYSN